jgi:hypothetical protein
MIKYLENEKNVLIPIDVKYFPARHVDEMLSLVRLPRLKAFAPCDFALIVASPQLAFDSIGKNFNNFQFSFKKEELKKLVLEQEASIQKSLKEIQNKILSHLECKNTVPVVYFPIFWTPYSEKGQTLYKDAWPNPVNALVVEQHLLVPDPQNEILKKRISLSLDKYNLSYDFMDSTELQSMYGGIHCATKSLHICRSGQ